MRLAFVLYPLPFTLYPSHFTLQTLPFTPYPSHFILTPDFFGTPQTSFASSVIGVAARALETGQPSLAASACC